MPVLQLGDSGRGPVVMARSAGGERRRIVCTCLLFPNRPDDRDLLLNMVVYAAFGPPDITIVETPDHPGTLLSHQLRLHGHRVVRTTRSASIERAREWPLVGSRVALHTDPDAGLGDPAIAAWVRAGGTFAAPHEGGLRTELTSADAGVLAADWSAWFRSLDPAAWAGGRPTGAGDEPLRGSIYGSRAILRTLVCLRRELDLADSLALPPPSSYAERLAEGLLGRLSPDGRHVDGLVATTAALLEVAQLAGGLPGLDSRASEAWLLAQVETAVPLDLIEIARVLRRPDIFGRALDLVSGPQPPELIARLRIARAELGIEAPLRSDLRSSGPVDDNLLLACEVLLGWALDVRGASPIDVDRRAHEIDEAVAVVAANRLRGMRPGDASAAEAASAEVEARAVLDGIVGVPVRSIAPSGGTSRHLVEVVVAESARVRTELEEARRMLAERDRRLAAADERGDKGAAILSLLWATLCVAGGLSYGVMTDPSGLALSLPIAGVVLAVGLAVLRRYGLAAKWAVELGSALNDGLTGVLGWLTRRAGGRPVDPSPDDDQP
jgi:hypothetical protein